MISNDDDDTPILSGTALAALQDFYTLRNKDQDAFEQLRSFTSHGDKSEILSISMFKEDWNASQFWFTDATAEFLASQLLQGCTSKSTIAIVSAPSVFIQLQRLLSTGQYPAPGRICLLEYDERFELLESFVKYDCNRPTDLPPDLKHEFDRILCDPPYHSKECVLKYAETIAWLWKEPSGTSDATRKRMVCTGETMKDVVIGAFDGVEQTAFQPEHTVRLDNKYACFADCALS